MFYSALKYKRNGFTLVELLVVVSVIGVLSGVTLSVVNVSQQRKNAQNAIRKSNLEKVVHGIESYFAAEGTYPAATDDVSLQPYVATWPTNNPPSSQYDYFVEAANEIIVITVPLCDIDSYPGPAEDGCTREAKYRTGNNDSWGRIVECDFQEDPHNVDCANPLLY